jgi:hypothetical protein
MPGWKPAQIMNRVEEWLREVESAQRSPVEARVTALLQAIRSGAQKFSEETWDQANERHAEEFIARLREEFPGRVLEISRPVMDEHQRNVARRWLPGGGPASAGSSVVVVERQKLPLMARRTTNYNYIFTVPGRSPERLLLVAHYDTWRGPGADDNTTGEEITKQYLLDDLRSQQPPALTHTYILAGSEECGLIGFTSQVLLAAGIGLANIAMTRGVWAVALLGAAIIPLANFRFGVSGSREYAQSLSPEEVARIKSVISVDSVGEGKMYIPDSSLGADFIRAFIPLEGYHALNDLLEEGAHLNGIRYNNFIAGGTTDHISFLELNSTFRDRLGDLLGCPRWLGCHKHGKRKIPASALVALGPGKASPLVFGGKIHTPNDTADRVYPKPLGNALRILDYWYHIMQGGKRIAQPRDLDEYHYAQLFRVRLAGDGVTEREEYWLALKDAVEPNRRNINGLYRVEAEVRDGHAVCRNAQLLHWGVHTRLVHQVTERLHPGRDSFERVHVPELSIESPLGPLRFAARGQRGPGWWGALEAAWRAALGNFERFLGSNTFLAFFAAAFLLAQLVDLAMARAFAWSYDFQRLFFDWFAVTLPLTVFLQLAVVLWLIGVKIPTMIDNNYKHLNRSDNLRSLRRVAL